VTGAPTAPPRPLPAWRWVDDTTLEIDGTRVTTNVLAGARGDVPLLVLKPPPLVQRNLDLVADLRPRRIVELGTKDGGSAALLALAADADLVVTVDLADSVPPALARFVEETGRTGRVVACTGIDQADREALLGAIGAAGASGDLDLVVDDASHLLGPTRASFEALFPLVRPGGWYLVEDWAVDQGIADGVAHRIPDDEMELRLTLVRTLFHRLNDPGFTVPPALVEAARADEEIEASGVLAMLGQILGFAARADLSLLTDLGPSVGRPLTDLAVEMVGLAASRPDLVAEVRVDSDHVAVRRGPAALDGAFRLDGQWTDHFGYLR
jgi:predicted O-methyltransferase YrrM